MTITSERIATATRPAAPTQPTRDGSIDAVRAALLVMVVALHAMMVGVSVGAAGPQMANALENQPWFAPVSWVVQIMPLFFIVGGFASITQWRALRNKGVLPAEYVRGRIDRLVRPTVVLVAVVGAALLAMTLLGVPAEIVATASFRIGQPLWFLVVYILCSALVPVMTRAHENARIASPLLLLAAVVATDLTRMLTGIDAVGFLNLLFAWLLVQQLGFWLADGSVEAISPAARAGILATALGALFLLTRGVLTSGPYSPDMLVNLNPPTLCLVILGVAQLMAFSLLRPRITAVAAHPRGARVIGALGQRSITVYLWHMPVLIALSALLLAANAATGMSLPHPLSPEWWASRPLWLVCVGLVVVPVVVLFARFERGRRTTVGSADSRPVGNSAGHDMGHGAGQGRGLHVGLDAVLGAGGVAVALVAGFAVLPASISLVLMGCALVGTRRLKDLTMSFRGMTRATLPADAGSWRTF